MNNILAVLVIVGVSLSMNAGCDGDYDDVNGIHSDGSNEIRLYEDDQGYME